MKTNITLDTAGISLSALCIIHCFFLPLLGAILPLFGVLSEFEWIHKGLVLLALPIALSLIFSTTHLMVQSLATLGISLLCGAAFAPQLHEIELPVTVFGALLLGLAHTIRILKTKDSH